MALNRITTSIERSGSGTINGEEYFMTSSLLLSMRVSTSVVLLATQAVTFTPVNTDAAQTENKTKQVYEIKVPQVSIPTVLEISGFINDKTQPEIRIEDIATVEVQPVIQAAALKVEEVVVMQEPIKPVLQKISYQFPPKTIGENRVYMDEPEIRAYLCPIMGQSQCNIFVAILKAENGTHECTRDNRGLNRNGSVDIGLAQINWNPAYNPPYTFEQLQDCKFNLDIALKKYNSRGFQPWYAYTSGAYKKFLN